MGNILAFLSRYHRFFLFLVLEAICFYLVVKNNSTQGATYMTWRHEMSGKVYVMYNDINYYFHLKESNDSLLKENARLHALLPVSKNFDTSETLQVSDPAYAQKYVYIPGRVINNSVTLRNNYLTLNIGKKHGIKPQEAVVTTSGIVGIVTGVSENFASVMSVLHKDFTVSAEIAEIKEIGSVIWDGEKGPEVVILKDVPVHIKVKKGQDVITSPYSEIFPEGTLIGTISGFGDKAGDAYHTIYIKLASDLRNIRQAYVVNNLMKDEQLEVEKERVE